MLKALLRTKVTSSSLKDVCYFGQMFVAGEDADLVKVWAELTNPVETLAAWVPWSY